MWRNSVLRLSRFRAVAVVFTLFYVLLCVSNGAVRGKMSVLQFGACVLRCGSLGEFVFVSGL